MAVLSMGFSAGKMYLYGLYLNEKDVYRMNVLHYALGFPPYRSGGLTKLCVDLMIQQSKEGKTGSTAVAGKNGEFK